jgi:hypothetical protein
VRSVQCSRVDKFVLSVRNEKRTNMKLELQRIGGICYSSSTTTAVAADISDLATQLNVSMI